MKRVVLALLTLGFALPVIAGFDPIKQRWMPFSLPTLTVDPSR